jgi:hypothetical protein
VNTWQRTYVFPIDIQRHVFEQLFEGLQSILNNEYDRYAEKGDESRGG